MVEKKKLAATTMAVCVVAVLVHYAPLVALTIIGSMVGSTLVEVLRSP